MKLTIAHLYYDLMNLYGENGNIKALKHHLEEQGIHITIRFLSIHDELSFDEYDMVYMGTGTEQNQKLVLKHMMSYQNEFKKAILEGKFFFITGNSLDLFGQYLIDNNEKKYKSIGIFDYHTKQENFRIVGEILGTCSFLKKDILGFQNRSSILLDVSEPTLIELKRGTGYAPNTKQEGIFFHHFYGTYTIGPVLVRNPEFLKYIIRELVTDKKKDFKWKPFHFNLENKAYQTFMEHAE